MSHLDDTLLLHKRRGRTARRRAISAKMHNTAQEIRGKGDYTLVLMMSPSSTISKCEIHSLTIFNDVLCIG